MILEILLVLSICIVAYTYVGHPAILYLAARLRPNPWSQQDADLSVAVFVSAFNEEKGIAAKLANLLAQDYQGRYVIVIASDGSSDRTAEIVRSFDDPRILLFDFDKNRGKAAMQNQLVPELQADVVIFSDATSVWPVDAVRRILRNFVDPNVGCVAVDLLFVTENKGTVEKGQSAYWRYERFLRTWGARVKTNIVASGTTYAIRRPLFSPIRTDIGEDLSNPLQIAMRGHRVIFDPDVVVEERSVSTHASEMKMRTRIAIRNVTGLATYARFLSPRYGFAAYQLFVHKYLRVFCWLPMLIALATNALLYDNPPWHWLLAAQLALYGLAFAGYLGVKLGIRSRFTYLFYYFVLLNYTCMIGFLNYLLGVRRATWTPER